MSKVRGDVVTHRNGNPAIDQTLKKIIAAYTSAAEGVVHSIYLEGSRADGSALDTSDIDLIVVYHHAVSSEVERSVAAQLEVAIGANPQVELDITTTTVEQLSRGATPMFKQGSALVYGPDLRPEVPLISINRWTRERMHAAYWLATHALQRPHVVRLPLPYPDPSGAYWGYALRTVNTPDGQEVPSTRNLVRVTGWMATALIALQAQQFVALKRDVPAMYSLWIGDPWSNLLHAIHKQCRDEWHYLVPNDPVDQQRLRDICAETLLFENDFLNHYRRFLLCELQGDDESRNHARFVMGLLPFDDDEIQQALDAAGGVLTHLEPDIVV